jgi:hypothetical protein
MKLIWWRLQSAWQATVLLECLISVTTCSAFTTWLLIFLGLEFVHGLRVDGCVRNVFTFSNVDSYAQRGRFGAKHLLQHLSILLFWFLFRHQLGWVGVICGVYTFGRVLTSLSREGISLLNRR